MSKEGKIKRGKVLYSYRNIDGVLPKVISSDEAKMVDVNAYLESVKPVKEDKK